MKNFLIVLCLIIGSICNSFASSLADTLGTERRNKQNVLLNASSESQPRVISLGIPQWGYPIMEDGLPTSMYSDFFPGFWTWRGGASVESMELARLDESAILLGNAGYYPMSRSKLTSDSFEGNIDYTFNHHGRNLIEVNLTTPLGKGWGLNINAFQDLNRGPNHLDVSYLQEHIQSYKAAISKRFADAKMFLTYQYTDRFNISDPYGPFIFNGDGSISQYDGFVLGKDQYLPSTSSFEYIDVVTGEKKEKRYVEDTGIRFHILTAGYNRNFHNGMTLEATSRLRLSNCDLTESMLGSIEQAGDSGAYKYEDGTPYDRYVQTRYMLYHQDKCNDWLSTVSLKGRTGNSSWLTGVNLWFNWTDNHIMTTNYAHEAKKNPKHLTYNGEMFYGHNSGAQFVEGMQSRIAAYAQNRWRFTNRFSLSAGLRLEYSGLRGIGVNSPIDIDNFNGAATLSALYRFNDRWQLEANAIATQQHAELWQYGETEFPTDLPKRNYLVRIGPNFKNRWIDIQSLLMYYRQDNNYYAALWSHQLTKPAGGYPEGYVESIYMGSLYSMRVLAWTTDMLLTQFKGFSFHGLLTLRDASYIDYSFQPTFSDGHSELYDFSGRHIVGSPAVEIELEPSYEINKWRIWTSLRYYSKQFVNITNSLHFNARWETFAGVDYAMNKNIKFSMNVVNFLNQTGASAGIQAASLSSDSTLFTDYLTAGTFIRPFTIEFSTHIRF